MGTDIKGGDRHNRWGQTNTKHHGFRIQKKIQEPGGWSKEIVDTTLALQSTAWIQNPSSS